jgi:hypothetical protein
VQDLQGLFRQIPCATEQGILIAEQGIISADQGIFRDEQGNRSPGQRAQKVQHFAVVGILSSHRSDSTRAAHIPPMPPPTTTAWFAFIY